MKYIFYLFFYFIYLLLFFIIIFRYAIAYLRTGSYAPEVVPTKGMNAVARSSRCSYALLGLPGRRVHRLVCFAPLTICGCFVVLQKPLWSAVVLRCKYCSMSFLDFIKGLYFFPSWLCNFKELFIPV